MEQAAKSNNPTLLHSLNNVKIALTHDLTLGKDETGTPAILKGQQRNLAQSTYGQAVQFLSDIADHTRFTGTPPMTRRSTRRPAQHTAKHETL